MWRGGPHRQSGSQTADGVGLVAKCRVASIGRAYPSLRHAWIQRRLIVYVYIEWGRDWPGS